MSLRLMVVFCMVLWAARSGAVERVVPAELPAQLAPWVSWALDGVPDNDCPYFFNSDQRRCNWSGPLNVSVVATGGEFDMTLAIYARAWVA